MVKYTRMLASTRGSFKSLTASAPAAETEEGGDWIDKVLAVQTGGTEQQKRCQYLARNTLFFFCFLIQRLCGDLPKHLLTAVGSLPMSSPNKAGTVLWC